MGSNWEYYDGDEWIPDPDINVTCQQVKVDLEAVFLSLIVLSTLQIGLGVLFWVRLTLWMRPKANRRCRTVLLNIMFWWYFFAYNR